MSLSAEKCEILHLEQVEAQKAECAEIEPSDDSEMQVVDVLPWRRNKTREKVVSCRLTCLTKLSEASRKKEECELSRGAQLLSLHERSLLPPGL